jgi:hypothetical protein
VSTAVWILQIEVKQVPLIELEVQSLFCDNIQVDWQKLVEAPSACYRDVGHAFDAQLAQGHPSSLELL